MAQDALGGSNITHSHAGDPCEKSLLNDIYATLECHRLHPRYGLLLTVGAIEWVECIVERMGTDGGHYD